MGFYEKLQKLSDPVLGNQLEEEDDIQTSNPLWIDGDTIDKDGVRYRLAGFDAPEVAKVLSDGTYKLGDPGGTQSIQILSSLANKTGFTNLVPITDGRGKIQKDVYGRVLANLVNNAGQSFKQKVLEGGLLNTGPYSSALETSIANLGSIDRLENPKSFEERDEFDKARNDIIRAELEDGKYSKGLKVLAHNEAELAAANDAGYGDYYQQNVVNVRSMDRTLTNESLNPLSDSWEQGWLGVMEGAYGFLEATGTGLNVDTLADIGEEGVERYRTKLNDYGTTLTDFRDVDGVMSGIRWISNNAALSVPYMAVTLAGIAVGNVAAPIVGGIAGGAIGISAPASVFAGNTYNEMEGKKSASAAVASGLVQATLDRLGLKAIFGAGKAPKSMLNEAVEALAKKQDKNLPYNIRKQIAQAQVSKASRREMISFVGDAKDIAKKQLGAKGLFKSYGMRLSAGAAGESLTETGQEVANYIAATKFSDKPFDMEEMNRRVINAAVTGGTLGAGFSTPGAVSNHVAWADIAFGQQEADGSEVGAASAFVDNFKKKFGLSNMPTNEEVAQEASEKIKPIDQKIEARAKQLVKQSKKSKKPNVSRDDQGIDVNLSSKQDTTLTMVEARKIARRQLGIETIDSRTQSYERSFGNLPINNRIAESIKMFPKLFRSMSNGIFHSKVLRSSGDRGWELASILGNGTSKTFTGSAWESDKIAQTFKILGMTTTAPEFYSRMIKNGKRNQRAMNKASDELRKVWDSAKDKKSGKFNPKLIPDSNPDKDFLIKTIESFNKATDTSLETQNAQAKKDSTYKVVNKDGKTEEVVDKDFKEIARELNYMLKYQVVDPIIVRKLKKEFLAALIKNGYSADRADKLYDAIVNKGVVDLDEAFSVTEGEISPDYKKSRTLEMSQKEEFKPFLEQNIFKNMETYAKTQARYLSHAKYIGKDGRIISQKLNEMEEEFTKTLGKEAAVKQTNKIAFEIRNALNAESGNYKRATTDGGKKLEQITRSYLLFTTLAGLSLSTISSFVELALTGRSFRADQIDGVLRAQANELTTIIKRGMGEIVNMGNKTTGATPHIETAMFLSNGQRIINLLGYGDYSLGAATTTGATEINVWQQNIMKGFFKWNGLQGWTNYTRAVRASIAADFINEKLKLIADYSYLVQQDKIDEGVEGAVDIENIVNFEVLKDVPMSSFEKLTGPKQIRAYDSKSFGVLEKKELDTITKEVAQATEYLRNLGLDVDRFVDFYMRYQLNIEAKNRAEYKVIANPKSSSEAIAQAQKTIMESKNQTSDILIDNTDDLYFLTPDELEFRNDQLREAVFNFVNEAVALPMAMNRPLIYQDPRFALFTQFQGFMATFTSNHLKRMWDEGVARGSPSMRYSTFITVGSMIMLGFVSQALKDWIKYDEGENEYLDNSQYIQRGVRSSGLLGTYERVIDQFMPLYPQGRSSESTIGNWLLSSASSESPGIGNLKRMVTGTTDIIGGDIEPGVKKWAKATPFIGSINRWTDSIGKTAGEIVM